MHCHNCGHRNPSEANFCASCGTTLKPPDADVTLALVQESEPESPEIPVSIDELDEGRAILVVKKGPEAGTKFSLEKDVITCGRDATNDLFLDDVTVSRRHAEIRRDGSEFSIKDVGSLNGIFVNRERVDSSALVNADEIQIGKFKLIFFDGGLLPPGPP